jgi:hypothetical protein
MEVAQMITLDDTQVDNRQEMSALQADGSSLWHLSGIARVNFTASGPGNQAGNAKESYRLLLGPALAGQARAIAIAAAATVMLEAQSATYSVQAIEADLDDETGRIQLMFEVSASFQANPTNAGPWQFVNVQAVAYQVTIHGTAA